MGQWSSSGLITFVVTTLSGKLLQLATHKFTQTYIFPELFYFITGNDVVIYFLSAANRINVFIWVWSFLDHECTDFEKVYSFGKGDSSVRHLRC